MQVDACRVGLEKRITELQSLLEQSQQQCQSISNEKQEKDAALQRINEQLHEIRSQNARLTSQVQYLEDKDKLIQVIADDRIVKEL